MPDTQERVFKPGEQRLGPSRALPERVIRPDEFASQVAGTVAAQQELRPPGAHCNALEAKAVASRTPVNGGFLVRGLLQ
ncbi:hypothetical protein Pan258_42210 [Symmachiella dynata]|nr:hypothetical protein Pan258_42210 [Symmachiella dynata]